MGNDSGFEPYLIESHGVRDDAPDPEPTPPYDSVITGEGDTEAEAYDDAVTELEFGRGGTVVDQLGLPAFWGDDEQDACADCERNGGQECFADDCDKRFYVSVYFNEESPT